MKLRKPTGTLLSYLTALLLTAGSALASGSPADVESTASAAASKSASHSGTLCVPLSGFKSERGRVVLKLFVKGDDVPKGAGRRERSARIEDERSKICFENLPFGDYALFAFHDENDNGTVDHNFLGIPQEPLGFSNGFVVTILSGIPDFDDLKFRFDLEHPIHAIELR